MFHDRTNLFLKLVLGTNLFRVTIPKHQADIGAVERIIESIKNTVSKSISGLHQLKMDNKELLTWIHLVIDKLNNCPLILGAPLGITLLPNHVLLGFRECYGDEINPEVQVQHQISRWRIVLNLYNSLWEQEYTRRRLTVTWKEQGLVPQVGDIVLFKNEPIYRHKISAARVQALLRRKNRDVYGATICYRREVGRRSISVNRHLNQLYLFMGVEKAEPQEQIRGLAEDGAAGTLAPEAGTQLGAA